MGVKFANVHFSPLTFPRFLSPTAFVCFGACFALDLRGGKRDGGIGRGEVVVEEAEVEGSKAGTATECNSSLPARWPASLGWGGHCGLSRECVPSHWALGRSQLCFPVPNKPDQRPLSLRSSFSQGYNFSAR